MSEALQSGSPAAEQGGDPGAMIQALRERGADRFDPIRFRFIEALARRAEAHGDGIRRLLEGRLLEVVAEYGDRFEKVRSESRGLVGSLSQQFPEAAEGLEQLWSAGDFRALRLAAIDLAAQRARGPLAELAEFLAQQGPERVRNASGHAVQAEGEARAELKSVSYFRDTWSRLSVDQQLAQALAQAPENAGPLNSHLLVLQSLKQMRDISPDYLNRFISHVDALLWLEQANGAGMTGAKNAARGEGEKKRKSGRPKSG